MKARDRCDEIIRLIDELLGEPSGPLPAPARVPTAISRAPRGGALR